MPYQKRTYTPEQNKKINDFKIMFALALEEQYDLDKTIALDALRERAKNVVFANLPWAKEALTEGARSSTEGRKATTDNEIVGVAIRGELRVVFNDFKRRHSDIVLTKTALEEAQQKGLLVEPALDLKEKSFPQLYREWVAVNDILPPDDAIEFFLTKSTGYCSQLRSKLRADGYEFKQIEHGCWHVVKRPTKVAFDAVKQDFEQYMHDQLSGIVRRMTEEYFAARTTPKK